jgi:hypothetical protein
VVGVAVQHVCWGLRTPVFKSQQPDFGLILNVVFTVSLFFVVSLVWLDMGTFIAFLSGIHP